MNAEFLRTLLRRSESDTLDFKRDQYRFVAASDEDRSELLKDILAFTNAWKESDAYIVIGVEEENGRAKGVVGATTELKDHEVQQFVNSKTNRPVSFGLDVIDLDGSEVTVVTIASKQARPLFLKKPFGKLRGNTVYVRRGSSTAEAGPDEIAEMGSSQAIVEAQRKKPRITLEFEHTTDRVHYEFDIPALRSKREREFWDYLSVYTKNDGDAVANIVEVTIRFPKFLLPGYSRGVLPKSIEEAELLNLSYSNWLSDSVSSMTMARPPAYRHQILPGKRICLGWERTFPHEFLISTKSQVTWAVHCDDIQPTEGITSYSDIRRVDKTKD